MVFLNPSILLGLLAASIPIIIHILNFRKLQKVEFSTLAFLKELQKSKIKKIKIKQWLLLLLRTLIIIFLVLAFARPTLDNVNLIGGSSTAKTSSVFIIDNSFSMSYVGDDGSSFNKSKMLAKNIISNMEDGDEFIFLISLDSVQNSTNRESALKIIDELELNLKLENSHDKLLFAKSILEKTQNINKEIFIFSDFQNSTFKNNADTLKDDISDDNITLYSFDISVENTSNYSISDLKLNNTILEINKPLTFSANAFKYSEEDGQNISASLFLNNKRVAQQSIDFNGSDQKTVKFETSINSTGLVEARVEIEEDNISQDNISYLNFLIPKNIDVLIAYDNLQDIIFLEAALKSSSESEQIRVTKIKASELSNQQLEKHKILFLVSSNLGSQLNINKYIESGSNLIFVPPSTITNQQIQQLSTQLNFLNNVEIISSSTNENNYLEFRDIDFQHPIFQNLFENTDKNKIESPNIFKHLNYRPNPSTQQIISLLNNNVFLGESKSGKGRTIFFNTSFTLDWSNFPIKGIFAPIISRIVFYLSATNNKTNNYLVGEEIPIDISQVTYPIIDVSLPIGDSKLNLDSFNNIYPFKNTKNTGSYKFYNNKDLLSFASVNVGQEESDLSKIDKEIMTNSFEQMFGNKYLLFDQNEDYLQKIKQARYGTELWKLLLTIALFLALIEMLIARNTKKDLARLN